MKLVALIVLVVSKWPALVFTEDACYVDHPVPNVALNRTTHGTPDGTNLGALAVDGQRQDLIDKCFMSTMLTIPWFAVDLGEEMAISTIVFVQRSDSSVSNVVVQIGKTMDSATFNPLTSGFEDCVNTFLNVNSGEVLYIHCTSTRYGRYIVVYIDSTQQQSLTVCELEVYQQQVLHHEEWTCVLPALQGPLGNTNLARGKPTYQSQLYEAGTKPRVVDGDDHTGYYTGHSCISTGADNMPWLVIDLGAIFTISGVAITPAIEAVFELFSIYVGNDGGPSTPLDVTDYNLCARVCDHQANRRRLYTCATRPQGRHLAIQMSSHDSHLILCEIEAYSDPYKGVAFHTVGTALTWAPPGQDVLYDGDDSTCVNINTGYTSPESKLKLLLHWDPAATNGRRDNAATHHCKTTFYVNVTHATNVQVSVFTRPGELTSDSVDDGVLSLKGCPLIGITQASGKVRSKFGSCHCETKCAVVLQVAGDISPSLCTIQLYD